jgi:serine/threonine-protein kinase
MAAKQAIEYALGRVSLRTEMPKPSLSRMGRYEIVGLLATGGMAEILLGRLVGPSGFERPVVLKRILPHLARVSTFVDMFVDEARIVAGIRHPNVVQVHELAHEDDELFLVMST